MAMKTTNLNTKPTTIQPLENNFQDTNNIQIPTPEELGFDSNDFNSKPLPQIDTPKEDKKGFFSKFSKKQESQKIDSIPMPIAPSVDNFSFPEFDKNPIQPVNNINVEKPKETEFLNNKVQTPIEMPKLVESAPKKEKKIEVQDLIDSHSEDDDTFDSISDKLNEIEAALKKHLDEIEQKMSVVKNIEKELKTLDVKIVKNHPKKPSKIQKSAPKKQIKKAVSKKNKKR